MRNEKKGLVINTLFLAVFGVVVLVSLTGCGRQLDILTPNIYISGENQVTDDQEQSKQQKKTDIIESISFNPDEYLTDEEFVFNGGVRLGMGYEEVLEILGGYDEADDNAPGVKSITKDGVHYGFYQIHETFTNQSDFQIDGVYRLLDVTLNESSNEVFPRGIKIGDSIEDVLNKFPGKDKKLRKWDYQIIYGRDQMGKPRAYLEFINKEECYHFTATTTKQVMRVNFDRENRVRSIEIRKEDS